MHGSLGLGPEHPQVLSLVREHEGQHLLCAFNFSDQVASLALPADWRPAELLDPSGGLDSGSADVRPGVINFLPWGGVFARLA